MTIEEVYAIPVDRYGWRLLPSGKRIRLGRNVTCESFDWARIGDWASIGYEARIGDGASIGYGARIGDGARIGNWASIGYEANIGDGARIGDGASIGYGARIGDGANIGDGAKFEKSPLAIQGTRHLACQSAPGVLTIGCCTFPFEHWTEHVLGIARKHGYTEVEGLEYERHVAYIVANGIPAEQTAREVK